MSLPSPPTEGAADWPPRPLPVPEVGTGLRLWRPEDAPALVSAWADPEVRSWLDPPDARFETAREWLAGDPMRRARALALDLVIDAEGVVAGEVGLSNFDAVRRACLIGYWSAPAFRRQGLVRKATATLAAWALEELGAAAVVAECAPENTASHRVVEAAGFSLLSAAHGARRVYVLR